MSSVCILTVWFIIKKCVTQILKIQKQTTNTEKFVQLLSYTTEQTFSKIRNPLNALSRAVYPTFSSNGLTRGFQAKYVNKS